MKRSQHLEPLSHDHFEGLHVAMRLRKGLANGAPAGEMARFIAHFWDTYLVNHFRLEEELLVGPLERAGGAELGGRMVREHRELRALVDALRTGAAPAEAMPAESAGAARAESIRADATPAALVEKFAASLPEHIRFEERELFPYLEQYLEAPDLAAIGNRLQAEHVDADLSWPVEFWL